MSHIYFVQVCYNSSRAYPVAYHFWRYIIGTVLHLPGLDSERERETLQPAKSPAIITNNSTITSRSDDDSSSAASETSGEVLQRLIAANSRAAQEPVFVFPPSLRRDDARSSRLRITLNYAPQDRSDRPRRILIRQGHRESEPEAEPLLARETSSTMDIPNIVVSFFCRLRVDLLLTVGTTSVSQKVH